MLKDTHKILKKSHGKGMGMSVQGSVKLKSKGASPPVICGCSIIMGIRTLIIANEIPTNMKNIPYIIITCCLTMDFLSSSTSLSVSMSLESESSVEETSPPDM